VVKAWRIGFADARVPAAAEVAALLELTDPDDVDLDDDSRSVWLRRPGMRLDLGAIAKGHAADRAAALYRAHGVTDGLVDLGGNVVALGRAGDGRPWRVGVQSPSAARGVTLGFLEVSDASAVTSGIYERVLEAGGRRYHHMIDPLTGHPFETDLASVTVLSPSSLQADIWATVAQRGGLVAGSAAVTAAPGIEAVFVTGERTVLATAGCREALTVTDLGYRLLDVAAD
ncbi:MAG TPA: FAD:protein FMN transferase, partial [Propionicimonas sp.]|nr:FAD:protein FMN transferase [Propionicimonas sp.]